MRTRTLTRPTLRWLVVLAMLGTCSVAGAQSLLGVRGGEEQGAAPAAPVDREIEGLVALAERTRSGCTEWAVGAPLADARNAHSTNTKEHMKEALEHGYNFLEGDVREEINAPHALEMRHDSGHEDGDNLTLRQWLAIGLASGRGLKLDIKEPQHMARVLDEVRASGVPEGRLMFNLGFDAMATWGDRIRAGFPTAWLAVNPPSGEGQLDVRRADAMVAQGRRFGGPVTFVVRFDLLTRSSLAALKSGGPVSVWNSVNEGPQVKDADALIRSLKRQGVDGVVDIRKSASLGERISTGVDRGLGEVRTATEGLVRKLPGL